MRLWLRRLIACSTAIVSQQVNRGMPNIARFVTPCAPSHILSSHPLTPPARAVLLDPCRPVLQLSLSLQHLHVHFSVQSQSSRRQYSSSKFEFRACRGCLDRHRTGTPFRAFTCTSTWINFLHWRSRSTTVGTALAFGMLTRVRSVFVTIG